MALDRVRFPLRIDPDLRRYVSRASGDVPDNTFIIRLIEAHRDGWRPERGRRVVASADPLDTLDDAEQVAPVVEPEEPDAPPRRRPPKPAETWGRG